jgi:hypothetical protein
VLRADLKRLQRRAVTPQRKRRRRLVPALTAAAVLVATAFLTAAFDAKYSPRMRPDVVR